MHPVALGGETHRSIIATPSRQPCRTRNQCLRDRKAHPFRQEWQKPLDHAAEAVAVDMFSPAMDNRARTRHSKLMQPLRATSAADAAADSHGMREFDSIEVCTFPYQVTVNN